MKYDQINRDLLQRIAALEQELQTFHGFRHLWAELVANHEPCGLMSDKLEAQQCSRLVSALGMAYAISQTIGITWVGSNADRKDADEAKARLDAVAKALADLRDWVLRPEIREWLNRSGQLANYAEVMLNADAALKSVKGGAS